MCRVSKTKCKSCVIDTISAAVYLNAFKFFVILKIFVVIAIGHCKSWDKR